MKSGIVKIDKEVNKIPNLKNITVIGDPGCDGLGAFAMSIFAKGLTAIDSDISIVVGDIVHKGIKQLYESVTNFVNLTAPNPLYMLCGNHDTAYYDDYFGLRNYLLYNDDILLIFLDDSKRTFEAETVDFLIKSLKDYERENIVIFFHIPPPNSVGTNTIKDEEWQKIYSVIKPYKKNVKYLICGHVHSYYEDDLDGIKLIVTGGGGARIEYVSDKVDPLKAHHHIVKLYFCEGKLNYSHISLENINFTKELKDKKLAEYLENALINESLAFVKYKLFASDAEEKGLLGLAKMFRAFSDSEFYHAKNHFYVLNKMKTIEENIANSKESEKSEVDIMYKGYYDYSVKNRHGLSSYSFYDSMEAEKIHHNLLEKALDNYKKGQDIDIKSYHTCSSCGYTFTTDVKPINCPICGAPSDKIFEVK